MIINKHIYLITLLIICHSLVINAQNKPYKLGLKLDDNSYQAMPIKAKLLKRDYENLPERYSLKMYSPTPKNQGEHGTCVGWSTAYAARTIIEAKQYDWTANSVIDDNAFAPGYIYHLIKSASDYDCQDGAQIDIALTNMKLKGVPKYNDFEESCVSNISNNIHILASKNKIKDFTRLFSISDGYNVKVENTKKALSQGNPVVIGMMVPMSFLLNYGDLWTPQERIEDIEGGHAMCVIGYDNNMYGGAFEIQNSWGTSWGNNGYVWIRYTDFTNFVKYGFEVLGQVKNDDRDSEMSGSIDIKLNDGSSMPIIFNDNNRAAGIVINEEKANQYKVSEPYSSGTRYRMYISNNEPAYVYAISSDLTGVVNDIFPPDEKTSPFLSYKGNNVAIPDEKYYIQMDNTVGTDYMCIIYSKEELDINNIKKQIRSQNGSFSEKVKKVLGSQLVLDENILFSKEKVSFKAKSKGKSAVAIIIAMEHK